LEDLGVGWLAASALNERDVCVDRIDFHVTLMAVAMTSINRFYETPFEGNKMNDGIFYGHWIETVKQS